MQAAPIQSVQVFGRKKTATAVCYCKAGTGLLKVRTTPCLILWTWLVSWGILPTLSPPKRIYHLIVEREIV